MSTYEDYEYSIQRRAAELMKGSSPFSNCVPVWNLIREADRYGWDIVPKAKPTSAKDCVK